MHFSLLLCGMLGLYSMFCMEAMDAEGGMQVACVVFGLMGRVKGCAGGGWVLG